MHAGYVVMAAPMCVQSTAVSSVGWLLRDVWRDVRFLWVSLRSVCEKLAYFVGNGLTSRSAVSVNGWSGDREASDGSKTSLTIIKR